jgi:protein-tyrosine kinase
MERIKQALDKARADREAAGITASRAPLKQAATIGTPKPIPENIEYTQTRVDVIDQDKLRNNRVIFGDADRVGLTAYKMLRTQVLQRMTTRGWNALAITSPAPADGKTLTSINLAISLARELHHTVLLVDMDLRNPTIHRYFGIEVKKGISDYLLHGAPLEEVMMNPGIERLVLLPGRVSLENSSEYLASPQMGALVQQLKSRYPSRMVLFDLPPVLSSDDALSFSPFVDAFLLVRDGKSARNELEHAIELLKDTTVLGTVLNDSNEKISAYY